MYAESPGSGGLISKDTISKIVSFDVYGLEILLTKESFSF